MSDRLALHSDFMAYVRDLRASFGRPLSPPLLRRNFGEGGGPSPPQTIAGSRPSVEPTWARNGGRRTSAQVVPSSPTGIPGSTEVTHNLDTPNPVAVTRLRQEAVPPPPNLLALLSDRVRLAGFTQPGHAPEFDCRVTFPGCYPLSLLTRRSLPVHVQPSGSSWGQRADTINQRGISFQRGIGFQR